MNEQYDAAVVVILGYLTAQGVSDAVDTYKGASTYIPTPKTTMSQNVDEQPDTIITGAELDNIGK